MTWNSDMRTRCRRTCNLPIAEILDKICEEMNNLLASAETLLTPDPDDDPLPEAPEVEET